jgi:hypothetical protein
MIFIEEGDIPHLKRLSKILFPNLPNPPIEGSVKSKWRNNQCDILVAWTHAHYKQDYLVTSDRRFHRRANELKAVGVREVIYPEAAAELARRL